MLVLNFYNQSNIYERRKVLETLDGNNLLTLSAETSQLVLLWGICIFPTMITLSEQRIYRVINKTFTAQTLQTLYS